MGGILEAAGRRQDLPIGGQADARPAPGFWETAAAAARNTLDAVPILQEDRLAERHGEVAAELARTLGGERSDYWTGDWWRFDPLHPYDTGKIFAGVQRARAVDPKAFADLPDTREEYERGVLRRDGGRDRDLDTVSRGSTMGMIAGSIGGGMLDPVNLGTLPLGGWGRTAATKILTEGLTQMGIEALQLPEYIDARGRLGEDVGSGEMAANVAFAGAGGAAFKAAEIGGGKAVAAGLDKFAPTYRPARALAGAALEKASDAEIFAAFNRAVPAEFRTPGEAAAMNVLQRSIEIERANPFPNTHAGQAAHEERLARATERLDNPAPRRSGGAVDRPGLIRFVIDDLEGGGQLVRDSGGLTKWGISERGNPGVDIASLTRGQAEAIYARKYWIAELGGLSRDAAAVAFDASVNHGQGFARRLIEASNGDAGKMLELRRAEYARLLREDPGKYGKYRNGWENRLRKLEGRLGREPGGPGEAVADITVDDLAMPPRPEALDAERPLVAVDGRPIPLEPLRAADIGVDAQLMQFKSGGDEFGVTDRLQGVRQWDPMAAGVVTVWEGADGRRLIADGHQRLGLARRIMAGDPAQDIHVNAFVLREVDGFTAQDARILTALKNIGEGTGTATDAGKVFREAGVAAEDALASRLPPKSALVRDGKALARLSDPAFGAIVNDVIPEHYGAAIGHLVEDPDKHQAMVELLAALDPPNRAQAEGILRQALAAGFTRETQEELFGSRELVSAIFAHKARVTEKVKAEIRKMKGAFQVAARNADTLEAAGSSIARDASAAAAKANAEALALVDHLAYRTGNEVSEILTDAARKLAEGEPLARVVRDAVDQLGRLDLAATLRAAGEPGDGPGGSGRGGVPDGEDPALRGEQSLDDLDPATRDELEAAGQLGFLDDSAHQAFDEPTGAGVIAAADSIRHDIEAELQAAVPAREIPDYEQAAAKGRPAAPVDERADLDTILQHANVNQAELAAFGRELEGEGAHWHDPGPKSAERITEKVENEGYTGAHDLKDIARGAISIERPEQADAIVAALRERFPDVFDKGWHFIPKSGYFDRKLIVTFEGGGRAELQIAPEGLWQAKKNGGQDLYNQARTQPTSAGAEPFNAKQRELYAAALADTPFAEMAAGLASGNRSASAAASSLTPSAQALPTSPGASPQPRPGLNAQAMPAASSTATARSSISNSSSFIGENPPRDMLNIGDDPGSVNVKGESVDPNVADRQRQEMELRAQAPLRGGNRTGQAQDGTMGLGLFDGADAPKFDLGDGQGERSAAEILRELDDEAADLDTLKACGLPGMGGEA